MSTINKKKLEWTHLLPRYKLRRTHHKCIYKILQITAYLNRHIVNRRRMTMLPLLYMTQCSIKLKATEEMGAANRLFPLTPLTAVKILFSKLKRKRVRT